MSDTTERFRELVTQANDLKRQTAVVGMELCQLAQDKSEEIVRAAYPKAKVLALKTLVEIKPTDLALSAEQAVETLKAANITPSLIIIDKSRLIVTLAEDLPPAAKVKK